jgi:hypothetical protein
MLMVPDVSVLGLLTVSVASIFIEKVFVAVFDAESVAVMEKLGVPEAVGIPERTPAEDRLKPAGSVEPLATVQV